MVNESNANQIHLALQRHEERGKQMQNNINFHFLSQHWAVLHLFRMLSTSFRAVWISSFMSWVGRGDGIGWDTQVVQKFPGEDLA